MNCTVDAETVTGYQMQKAGWNFSLLGHWFYEKLLSRRQGLTVLLLVLSPASLALASFSETYYSHSGAFDLNLVGLIGCLVMNQF